MTTRKGSSISSKVTTYWLLGSSCFLSPSFSSAWGRFWAVHSMSVGTSTLALVVTFVDPSDRIDWSAGGGDGPVATFIGREERRPAKCTLVCTINTPTRLLEESAAIVARARGTRQRSANRV